LYRACRANIKDYYAKVSVHHKPVFLADNFVFPARYDKSLLPR